MKFKCDNRALREMMVAQKEMEKARSLYTYLCQTSEDAEKIEEAREDFKRKSDSFSEKQRLSMSQAY